MHIVYGIANCDTTQKALKWLDKHKVNYEFYDHKKQEITADKLKRWCKQVGWEKILNRKSATYRELDDAAKQSLTNEKAAIQMMRKNASIIKRPVIEMDGHIAIVGFDEKEYQKNFGR